MPARRCFVSRRFRELQLRLINREKGGQAAFGLNSCDSPLFSGRQGLIVEGRMHRVPWQRRALNADRKLAHAGKYFQVAELVWS